MDRGAAAQGGHGGEKKHRRDPTQDAKLTAAEFELYKQLPSGAKVVVTDRDHGPPATYTIRFLGQADLLQNALSGAEDGVKDQVVSGVLEKYLRAENILSTARNCAGNQGIDNILKSSLQYTVPLFQRKYCWQLGQWRTLWKDIRQLAAIPSHHMGKLVIYEEPDALVLDTAREQLSDALQDTEYQQFSAFSSARNGMSRAVQAAQLMVVDGQQRLTTTCVILAALRDVAEIIAARNGGAELQAQAAELAAATNSLLFREDTWFKQYCARASSDSEEAAASGDFPALLEWFYSHTSFLPTHDDRRSYAAAVLPRTVVSQNLSQQQSSQGIATLALGFGTTPSASVENTVSRQIGDIFCWAATVPAGLSVDAAPPEHTFLNSKGFAKLLRLMGKMRLEDDMPEAAWLQLCASVEEDPARGLQLATFQNILREELQVGPVALAQAVEELYMRTVHRASDLEGNGREQDRPSLIQDCKDYYLEQAVRYVSSPTMDEAAAKAAIARLTELSDRVKRRLKFVFFELPSDASVQLFFEQLAMKESYSRASKMTAETAPGVSISLVDLCRNKILGYFADEHDKIQAYEQYWLEIERRSGAAHGNLEPLESFLGYYLNTEGGMGGPEVAGELYKVFRTWLSERILQGSSTVALAAPPAAVAKGGAEDGGAEDTGAETAAAAPTTVETIAAIVKEILAELAAAASCAPYPLPPLPAKHQAQHALVGTSGRPGPNWAPEQSKVQHYGQNSGLVGRGSRSAGAARAGQLAASSMGPPPPRAPNRSHAHEVQEEMEVTAGEAEEGHDTFDPTAGIGGYGSTIAPSMLAAANSQRVSLPQQHRPAAGFGGTGGATGVAAGTSAAMQRDWAGALDMMAPGTTKSFADSAHPGGS